MKPAFDLASLSGKILLSTRPVDISMLAHAAASNLIYFCNNCEPDSQERPAHGPAYTLGVHMNSWADHDIINAVQSQASLIYAVITFVIKNPNSWVFNNQESTILMTSALRSYQEWKTKYIKKDQKRHGSRWGSGTGFNQMDWTDQNERFLAMLQSE